ncbi:MAG: transporter [SAR86 cluster bacterium]|uniref:Transporter n=1 Tax=SAR86 cluster bacterium TaxID=2030880 RepID=A0A2A4X4C3_9GAMM|nr:MAG: transporter [SAR86 cluster bacterium]
MAGEDDLDKLLVLLQPKLLPGDFVFYTAANLKYGDLAELQPLASYQEEEGLTLVLDKQAADGAGLAYDAVYNCITLMVHSSLDAVGLTAAVSGKLAANGISANIIAAFYHDHVFVPKNKAQIALRLLTEL